jgi:hypothetical protein
VKKLILDKVLFVWSHITPRGVVFQSQMQFLCWKHEIDIGGNKDQFQGEKIMKEKSVFSGRVRLNDYCLQDLSNKTRQK